MAETVGVRELRQQASALIRRVQAGEEIIIAVSGRPAARMTPLEPMNRTWRTGHEIAHIFISRTDPSWLDELKADRNEPMDEPDNPWDEVGR
jgi:prevent-host-death family protein